MREPYYTELDTLEAVVSQENSRTVLYTRSDKPVHVCHDKNALVSRSPFEYVASRDFRIIPNSNLIDIYDHRFNSKAPALDTSAVTVVDEPHFYFFYPWARNYQHFLTELFPRLNYYWQVKALIPTLKLFAPKIDWQLDILSLLEIESHEITLHSNQEADYLFRTLYSSSSCSINYHYLSDELCDLLSQIRAMQLESTSNSKYIFIDRMPDYARNAGRNRRMENAQELRESLEAAGFSTVYCEELKVTEKKKLLDNAEIIVTPVGANAMNLALANNVKKVVLITHPNLYGMKWFTDVITLNSRFSTEVIEYTNTSLKNPNDTKPNSPYCMDVDDFMGQLSHI